MENKRLRAQIPASPDSANYTIEDVALVNGHLVMKVKYPNCAKCSYEGTKIMVFLNTTTLEALKWKVIDPHFRERFIEKQPYEAPSPAARFPASSEGWQDALAYAKSQTKT